MEEVFSVDWASNIHLLYLLPNNDEHNEGNPQLLYVFALLHVFIK